jgi:hypothetical protein
VCGDVVKIHHLLLSAATYISHFFKFSEILLQLLPLQLKKQRSALPTTPMTFFEAVKKLIKGSEGGAVVNTNHLLLSAATYISHFFKCSEISSIMHVFHHKMVSISVFYIII